LGLVRTQKRDEPAIGTYTLDRVEGKAAYNTERSKPEGHLPTGKGRGQDRQIRI